MKLYRRNPTIIIRFFLVLMLLGCKGAISDLAMMNYYLNDEDNGCIKSKKINSINISIKYVPASYMVLRNVTNDKKLYPKKVVDSMLDAQEKFMTFIMTIHPDTSAKNDGTTIPVMYYGLENEAEYIDRVFSMNFSLNEHIKLYAKEKFVDPLAAFVENVYELSHGRNFLIMFPKSDFDSAEEVTFIFNDPYYRMGTLQFHFRGHDLLSANRLNIQWEKTRKT